jgi:Hg(II)-responsive transcriptional regulator
MDPDKLRTGEVAARAGVNVQTLRYYERRGLLHEPERRRSGYREYPAETVRVIRFIKRAQELGFTLTEVEDLLRLREDEGASCAEVQTAAEMKIGDIEQKIQSLRAMRRALRALVRSCATGDLLARECPILEALDDPKERTP